MAEKLFAPYVHAFKIHVPNFLEETIQNGMRPKDKAALSVPIQIFYRYLMSVAERCAEIKDPILDRLMYEMSLYEQGNPESKDYDPDMFKVLVERYEQEKSKP